MGWFAKLKKIVDILTLGQVTLLEKQIEIGGKFLKATIDVNNEIVRLGDEIFRSAPGEVFFPGLGPLSGLLKNEAEDELIMLNPLGIVPSITVFTDTVLVVGDLIGVVQHRTMRRDELKIVHHVFRDSLKHSNEIRLTNLAGLEGRPFTMPTRAGSAVVNLGSQYVHDGHIRNIPLLIHELTHVWQLQRSLMPEVFFCLATQEQIANELGKHVYDYTPGSQWSGYGIEQQAHILEDWVRNAHPMKIGSPLFRYVNGNVRPGNNDARTASGGSICTWFAEAKITTGSLREINPPRPKAWW